MDGASAGRRCPISRARVMGGCVGGCGNCTEGVSENFAGALPSTDLGRSSNYSNEMRED